MVTTIGIPTEKYSIRNDSGGKGYFGASRGKRKHTGIDLASKVGSQIYAPISGTLKKSKAKSSSKLSGLKIIGNGEHKGYIAYLFYVKPNGALIGKNVKVGDRIAVQQDLSLDYSESVTDHVHFALSKGGTKIDPQNDSKVKLTKITTDRGIATRPKKKGTDSVVVKDKFFTLTPGMFGRQVRRVQRGLQAFKILSNQYNGAYYDLATYNAVKQFQKTNTLTVDGLFGIKAAEFFYKKSLKFKPYSII